MLRLHTAGVSQSFTKPRGSAGSGKGSGLNSGSPHMIIDFRHDVRLIAVVLKSIYTFDFMRLLSSL